MAGREQAAHLRQGQGPDLGPGEMGQPGAGQIEQIGIAAHENQIEPLGHAAGGAEPLHGRQTVHDVQMGTYGRVQVQDVGGQAFVGLLLVLLARQAAHEVFQAHGHARLEMGLDDGHVDEKRGLGADGGGLGRDPVLEGDVHGFQAVVQVRDAHAVVGGQPVHHEPRDDADLVAVKAAVGPLPHHDLPAAPVLQDGQDGRQEPQVGGVARERVHVGVEIGFHQDERVRIPGEKRLMFRQGRDETVPDFGKR